MSRSYKVVDYNLEDGTVRWYISIIIRSLNRLFWCKTAKGKQETENTNVVYASLFFAPIHSLMAHLAIKVWILKRIQMLCT